MRSRRGFLPETGEPAKAGAPNGVTNDMQPELPWNVAGIGPEAREAARASARREGLSVGEWLTRRILRGLAETDQPVDRWWADPPRSRAGAPRYEEPERLPAHIPF